MVSDIARSFPTAHGICVSLADRAEAISRFLVLGSQGKRMGGFLG